MHHCQQQHLTNAFLGGTPVCLHVGYSHTFFAQGTGCCSMIEIVNIAFVVRLSRLCLGSRSSSSRRSLVLDDIDTLASACPKLQQLQLINCDFTASMTGLTNLTQLQLDNCYTTESCAWDGISGLLALHALRTPGWNFTICEAVCKVNSGLCFIDRPPCMWPTQLSPCMHSTCHCMTTGVTLQQPTGSVQTCPAHVLNDDKPFTSVDASAPFLAHQDDI